MSAPLAVRRADAMRSGYGPAMLVVLPCLFAGRVLGQLAALVWSPSFLPPYNRWDSDALPYPLLLTLQLVLLAFQARVAVDLWLRRGVFARERPRAARILARLAAVYCAVIVARYALTMAFVPELRWFGHAIPIAFHFVLAGWVWALARCLALAARRPSGSSGDRREQAALDLGGP